MKSHHHLGYLMDSIEYLLEQWGLWRATGQIYISKNDSFQQDMVQVSTGTPLPPFINDRPQRFIDKLVGRHLTLKQKAVITVEYRAHPKLAAMRYTRERAELLNISPRSYRSLLGRAHMVLDSHLPTFH